MRRGDDDGGIIPIGGPDGKSCGLFLLGVLAGLAGLVELVKAVLT